MAPYMASKRSAVVNLFSLSLSLVVPMLCLKP